MFIYGIIISSCIIAYVYKIKCIRKPMPKKKLIYTQYTEIV